LASLLVFLSSPKGSGFPPNSHLPPPISACCVLCPSRGGPSTPYPLSPPPIFLRVLISCSCLLDALSPARGLVRLYPPFGLPPTPFKDRLGLIAPLFFTPFPYSPPQSFLFFPFDAWTWSCNFFSPPTGLGGVVDLFLPPRVCFFAEGPFPRPPPTLCILVILFFFFPGQFSFYAFPFFGLDR